MNIENLLIVVVAIATIAIMAAAAINPILGGHKIKIGRTFYGAGLALILGAICGAVVNVFADPQMGYLIGIVAGFVLGYTMLINKIVSWLWKQFKKISTWWIQLIIGLATLSFIIWVVMTYIV